MTTMTRISLFISLFASVSLCSCINLKYPSGSKLTKTAGFDQQSPLRILVLPFKIEGRPGSDVQNAYADDISATLLSLGHQTIDRTFVSGAAQELGIDIRNGIPDKDIIPIAKKVNADAVFLGTVEYFFLPAEEINTPASVNSRTDSSGKIKNIDVRGSSSEFHGEHYAEHSISARIVSVKDGSTLVSSFIPCDYRFGTLNSLLASIMNDQLPQKK